MYRKAVIRPFRPEDEALLFGLANLVLGADERTIAILERETVFVAEVEGAPAGYVAVERHAHALRVDQLFVNPQHEADEIGGQLLSWVEGYAISQKARALQVVVEPRDRSAINFYRGRGFSPVGDELFELVLPLP